jgi:hypothetical protein
MPLEPTEEQLVEMYSLHDELGAGAVFAYVRDLVLEAGAKRLEAQARARDEENPGFMAGQFDWYAAREVRAMKGDGK